MEAGTSTGGNAELEHPSVLIADADAPQRRGAERLAVEQHRHGRLALGGEVAQVLDR